MNEVAVVKVDESNVRMVLTVLSAYLPEVSLEAIERYKVGMHKHIENLDFKPFNGTIEEVPEGHDWMIHNGKAFIRKRPPKNEAQLEEVRRRIEARKRQLPARVTRKRTDTGVKQAPVELRCPTCGEGGMFREAICPGCAEGKRGYKIRLLCGDCDYTALL